MAAAAIGAAGSYMAAQQQASAAKAAARAQERIAAQNIAFQTGVYNQNVKRVDPWVQYGSEQRNALAELMPSLTSRYDMAKYQAGPEYQNMMAQTDRERNALMAKSSASGMYGSGTMANQLQSNAAYLGQQGYQQGLQNYEGQNKTIYDMLNTASNVGLNAANQQGNMGANMATNVGNAYNNLGNAQANSAIAQGQAWGRMANQLGQIGMETYSQWDKSKQQQADADKYYDFWGKQYGTTQPQQQNQMFQQDLSRAFMPMSNYGYSGQQGPTAENSFLASLRGV